MSDERQELEQKINLKFIRPPMNYKKIPNYSDSSPMPVFKQDSRPFRLVDTPRSKIDSLPRSTPPPGYGQEVIQRPVMIQTPEPTCVDVHDHAKTCSVCSRLYKNYTAIYISVIVFLCLIILFLLKKLLTK